MMGLPQSDIAGRWLTKFSLWLTVSGVRDDRVDVKP